MAIPPRPTDGRVFPGGYISFENWPLVQWQDNGLWIRESWFESKGANYPAAARASVLVLISR